jgi:type II secretory pathway pseudopilin PulG
MIAIAIIGILASTLFPYMSGYVMRARDTARQSDIYSISLALSSYILAEESYPAHVSGCYPYESLSGYTTKKYVSPSGTGYNE